MFGYVSRPSLSLKSIVCPYEMSFHSVFPSFHEMLYCILSAVLESISGGWGIVSSVRLSPSMRKQRTLTVAEPPGSVPSALQRITPGLTCHS